MILGIISPPIAGRLFLMAASITNGIEVRLLICLLKTYCVETALGSVEDGDRPSRVEMQLGLAIGV